MNPNYRVTRVSTVLLVSWIAVAMAPAIGWAQTCIAPPTGIVSWWPGDGIPRDVQDGNCGMLQGGATYATGQVGQAFSLDGVDDHILIGNPNNLRILTDLTIEAWVRPTGFSPTQHIQVVAGKWAQTLAGDAYELALINVSGTVRVLGAIGAPTPDVSGILGGTVPLNQWSHVAMTYVRSTGDNRIFVNGVQVAQRIRSGGITSSTANVLIGRESSTLVRAFKGLIDEPTIYGRALSAPELLAIVQAGSAGKCKPQPPTPGPCIARPPGLVSWWPASGSTADVVDGNTGTLMNGAVYGPGLTGQAFDLDGVDDHVRIGNPANLTSFPSGNTLEAWVNPCPLPAGQMAAVIAKWGQSLSGDGYGIWLHNLGGTIVAQSCIGDGSTHCEPGAFGGVVPVGQWSHVATTYEVATSQIRVFVNGAQVAQTIRPGGIWPADTDVLIGREDSVLPRPYRGRIDEVGVYSRPLSPIEIQQLYLAGSGGKCLTDPDPPMFVMVPAAATYPCAGEVPAADPSDAIAIDNEGPPTMTVADTDNGGAGTPASPLVITRTWTATDASANTATATQIITVIDDTAPVLTVPEAIQTSTGPGIESCATVRIEVETGSATATDNCSAPTVTVSGLPVGGQFPVGETILTWTATDAAGNTAIGSQSVTVTCPIGDLTGVASRLCNGQTQPAAGVLVSLLHEGSPFLSTSTSPAGEYRFDDLRQGTYTVSIAAPSGYAVAPSTQLVTLDQAQVGASPFVFTCLLADVTGQVIGSCNGLSTGQQGVTVDLYREDGGGVDVLIASTATDAGGGYRFDDLPLGDYTVGVVPPLGYSAAGAVHDVTLAAPDGSVNVPSFLLTCQPITAQPRAFGWWKHQVNVYLTGKGNAQVALADLLGYVDEMVAHFNENLINPVVVYIPGATQTNDKLLQLQQLLTVNRGGTALDRAKQHLLALLLNVSSARISQEEGISDNGATVSQAITHSHDLIVDGLGSNDETARTICELINDGQRVPAGMVPASTRVITYELMPDAPGPSFALELIAPNPARGQVAITFALPRPTPATIDILDLAGRLVLRRQVGEQGVGRHTIRLDGLATMPPGIYLVRLRQGRESLVTRLALIR